MLGLQGLGWVGPEWTCHMSPPAGQAGTSLAWHRQHPKYRLSDLTRRTKRTQFITECNLFLPNMRRTLLITPWAPDHADKEHCTTVKGRTC